MNTNVNYEIAKLLKEKGFDKECYDYYTLQHSKKPYITQGIGYNSDKNIKFDWNCNSEFSKSIRAPYPNTYHESQCSAPTIADTVMWIYKKYGIWIWVQKHSTLFRPYAEEEGNEKFGKWEGHKYDLPIEAYQAAIKYCLEKII